MVGATSCLDLVVHAIPVVGALPTVSPCVDNFHVDPSLSRDSVERCVRRKCLMNRVDLVQLGRHVTNPQDPYTVVRDRGCKARHVKSVHSSQIEQGGEQHWKNPGDPPLWRGSYGIQSHGLFWHMLQIWRVTSLANSVSAH